MVLFNPYLGAGNKWVHSFLKVISPKLNAISQLVRVLHFSHYTKGVFWYLSEDKFICIVLKNKQAVCIMVFGVVSCDYDIMLPFIFPHGLRLNAEAYIKCLEEVVLIWITKVAAGRSYFLQPDNEPCYTGRRTQCWLSENFCNHHLLHLTT